MNDYETAVEFQKMLWSARLELSVGELLKGEGWEKYAEMDEWIRKHIHGKHPGDAPLRSVNESDG